MPPTHMGQAAGSGAAHAAAPRGAPGPSTAGYSDENERPKSLAPEGQGKKLAIATSPKRGREPATEPQPPARELRHRSGGGASGFRGAGVTDGPAATRRAGPAGSVIGILDESEASATQQRWHRWPEELGPAPETEGGDAAAASGNAAAAAGAVPWSVARLGLHGVPAAGSGTAASSALDAASAGAVIAAAAAPAGGPGGAALGGALAGMLEDDDAEMLDAWDPLAPCREEAYHKENRMLGPAAIAARPLPIPMSRAALAELGPEEQQEVWVDADLTFAGEVGMPPSAASEGLAHLLDQRVRDNVGGWYDFPIYEDTMHD